MKKETTRKSVSQEPASVSETVISGTLSEIKRLIKDGAIANQATQDGFTPLMLAAMRGDPKIVEHLLGHGSDVNARNEIGQTALMIAAKAGHKPIVQQLMGAGADLNALDNEKRNAIRWATTEGDFPEVISLLGVSGAHYDARDIRGITPLMSAALLGFSEAVGILLTLGADETIEFEGKTAYQMASQKGRQEICKTMEAILKNRPKSHKI